MVKVLEGAFSKYLVKGIESMKKVVEHNGSLIELDTEKDTVVHSKNLADSPSDGAVETLYRGKDRGTHYLVSSDEVYAIMTKEQTDQWLLDCDAPREAFVRNGSQVLNS